MQDWSNLMDRRVGGVGHGFCATIYVVVGDCVRVFAVHEDGRS